MFLTITGVNRYAKIWINEVFSGEHLGYLSAFEYDVGQQAKPGQTATITIQVDSKQRWQVDAMYGCSALSDYIDEILRPAYVNRLGAAFGDTSAWKPAATRGSAIRTFSRTWPNARCLATAVQNGEALAADRVKLEVFDQNGQWMAAETASTGGKLAPMGVLSIGTSLRGAKLWTPDHPKLYTARLSLLKGDKTVNTVESRFGMRQFAVDGPHLLLNGKRLMLCGYGDDHIYPEQIAMPCDKQLHLKRLRMIKSYGFNHVRHHSTIMPSEYYDACDEVGIIATAEFPICYAEFLPSSGPVWQRYVPPGTDPGHCRGDLPPRVGGGDPAVSQPPFDHRLDHGKRDSTGTSTKGSRN